MEPSYTEQVVASLRAAGMQAEFVQDYGRYAYGSGIFNVMGCKFSYWVNYRGRPSVEYRRIGGGPKKGYSVREGVEAIVNALPQKLRLKEIGDAVEYWREMEKIAKRGYTDASTDEPFPGIRCHSDEKGIYLTFHFQSIGRAGCMTDFYQELGGSLPDR